MSSDNVEIVRRGSEAFARGDLPTALQDAHPDIVTHRVHPLPDAVEYRGTDGFLQIIAEWVEGFDEFRFTSEDFVDCGDRVLVRVHQWAKGEASGATVEAVFWFVYELSNGKIVRLDMYATREQAIEAHGLRVDS